MFGKLSFSLILTASLSCVGQVTTTGGYATTAGPAVNTTPVNPANAPMVSTPDIALPGSGPAVGAPINNANDSRVTLGPSIANPNVIVPEAAKGSVVQTPAVSSESSSTGQMNGTRAANAEPFETGIQHFVSDVSELRNPELSLAEIAARLKAQKRPAAHAFNNDSIAQLHAAGVETGNLGAPGGTEVAANRLHSAAGPESSASSESPAIGNETLTAQNQPPALPESDQPAPASSSTAVQQRHRSVDQSTAGPASANNESAEQTTHSQAGNNQAKLPQSASPLPLLLLVGALGIAGGAAYLWKR